MSSLPSPLSSLAAVELDPSGVFKYVLIEAYQTTSDGTEHSALLVRGWARAEYHADIYDDVGQIESGQAKIIVGFGSG